VSGYLCFLRTLIVDYHPGTVHISEEPSMRRFFLFAGSNGDSRRIEVPKPGANTAVRYRDRLEDDLIYADGAFVQLPVQAKPREKKQ
jgi:hypothetical protein